ncbi:MAG: NifU family protein, partial [Acidobacteria bacterium]|nr:NifU family protein [Acidobacteriota bacterium]
SLQERVETALATVRPMLASHGGDVELVAVEAPDTVRVRFLGACDGCPASQLTFVAGVKKAIQESCPEIEHIEEVRGLARGLAQGPAGGAAGERTLNFVSPFALHAEGGWQPAASLDAIPEGGVLALEIDGRDLLLSKNGPVVSAFDNACAHLGMPLDSGQAEDGILTCPFHGFRYLLETGECLTAPEVQLEAHAVRVVGAEVEVRLNRR